jgi:hypothetical protein
VTDIDSPKRATIVARTEAALQHAAAALRRVALVERSIALVATRRCGAAK